MIHTLTAHLATEQMHNTARPELLTEEEILHLIATTVPGWERIDNSIVLEIGAANFVAAVGIINAIAILAETLDHHPDIFLYGWNKLRITCSTHDRGGLTKLDFELAWRINGLGI